MLTRNAFCLAVSLTLSTVALQGCSGSTGSNSKDGQFFSVHQHIFPSEYLQSLQDYNVTFVPGFDPAKQAPFDLDNTLAHMNKRNIRSSILSLSFPGLFFPQLGEKAGDYAVYLAYESNNDLFNVVNQPKARCRFGGFVALPLPLVAESITETRRGLDSLHLDGVVLNSNYGGVYLGDRRLDPLYEELDNRSAVVLIHPVGPVTTPQPDVPGWMLDFVFDTTRTIVSMLVNGTFTRYPHIRFIVSHGGGTVPFLEDRIEELQYDETIRQYGDPKKILRQLYYDTTNIEMGSTALAAVAGVADPARTVFGDDYPCMTDAKLDLEYSGFKKFDGWRGSGKKAVAWGNAAALFPRLRDCEAEELVA